MWHGHGEAKEVVVATAVPTSQAHSLARRRAASIAKDVLQTRMRIASRHEKDRYWAKIGIGFGKG